MATDDNKILIIGIGDDGLEGLTDVARKWITQADLLIGEKATLAHLRDHSVERHTLGSDLDETLAVLREQGSRSMVVLASGDPLFYGTARYLCDQLGEDRFEVVPHVSSMQLAFARVKETWEEAYLTNLATQPLAKVVERVRTADKVGLFTTEETTPSAVANALLQRGIDYFWAYVCENLGSPDERVTKGELADLTEQSFAPLNVMILVRRPDAPDRPSDDRGFRLFGNPDDAFLQSQPKHGLLTPVEIRTVALAELNIGPSAIVWDIGAGSGSVAVEAAGIAEQGEVFAIEKDVEDFELIKANAERFGRTNLTAVHGEAPEALADLPNPHCIFIGGTGRGVASMALDVFERLVPGGRLVVNSSSLENVAELHGAFGRQGVDAAVRMMNIARGTYQLERLRLESLNPSFLISVVKPAS